MASVSDIWSASDYAPTSRKLEPVSQEIAQTAEEALPAGAHVVDIGAGHGTTARALLDRGFNVTAVEPAAAMRAVGRKRAPEAEWVDAAGEEMPLAYSHVDAVISSFGSMFCDPLRGPQEWARVLKPGGVLIMSAWDETGFLAEMTRIMQKTLEAGADMPPHMLWCREAIVRERLGDRFDDISISRRTVSWTFESAEAGMDYYLHGSPTHAWVLGALGDRRGAMLEALRLQLLEYAGADGAIRTSADYGIISARLR